ncbi:uncharacterized protein LOC115438943 [Sphaeramia orbicularis]|uniref:uncharacterized protein LOC115438943 n=1 Tax=Sphaeramia orbicularis TaxID=375764 RepID=UPI00117E4D71|nr:uncharacterized protein LOC115438943 [Sphaeramia orbicularis]
MKPHVAEEPQTPPPAPPTPSDNGTQPALQAGIPVSAESAETLITEPSDPTSEAVVMEDPEQSESAASIDVTITPENEDDARGGAGSAGDVPLMSEVCGENASVSSPDSSALVVKPEEDADKLPQINEQVFKVLTAAVRQHRLTKGNGSQPTSRSSPLVSAASSPRDNVADPSGINKSSLEVLQHRMVKGSSSDSTEKEDQVSEEADLSADYVSSDYFNMEDFVTVDEVCDDGGDTSPQPHHSPESSSKQSSETKREGDKERQGSSHHLTPDGVHQGPQKTQSALPRPLHPPHPGRPKSTLKALF